MRDRSIAQEQEPLVAKAKQILDLLRPHMFVFYDESGAIGVVIAGRMKSEHRFALLSILKHSAKNKLIFEILSLCAKEIP